MLGSALVFARWFISKEEYDARARPNSAAVWQSIRWHFSEVHATMNFVALDAPSNSSTRAGLIGRANRWCQQDSRHSRHSGVFNIVRRVDSIEVGKQR